MAAARNTGPPMPSGSRSLGGTCTIPSRAPAAAIVGTVGIPPVISLAVTGEAASGIGAWGIATCALSSVLGAEELFDCGPIGVGEVIDGAVGAGAGAGAGA